MDFASDNCASKISSSSGVLRLLIDETEIVVSCIDLSGSINLKVLLLFNESFERQKLISINRVENKR